MLHCAILVKLSSCWCCVNVALRDVSEAVSCWCCVNVALRDISEAVKLLVNSFLFPHYNLVSRLPLLIRNMLSRQTPCCTHACCCCCTYKCCCCCTYKCCCCCSHACCCCCSHARCCCCTYTRVLLAVCSTHREC